MSTAGNVMTARKNVPGRGTAESVGNRRRNPLGIITRTVVRRQPSAAYRSQKPRSRRVHTPAPGRGSHLSYNVRVSPVYTRKYTYGRTRVLYGARLSCAGETIPDNSQQSLCIYIYTYVHNPRDRPTAAAEENRSITKTTTRATYLCIYALNRRAGGRGGKSGAGASGFRVVIRRSP